MISGGSCDTEDWSNDAENSALHHRNKLHFKIIIQLYWIVKIFHNIIVLLFVQINAALDIKKQTLKSLTPNFWQKCILQKW